MRFRVISIHLDSSLSSIFRAQLQKLWIFQALFTMFLNSFFVSPYFLQKLKKNKYSSLIYFNLIQILDRGANCLHTFGLSKNHYSVCSQLFLYLPKNQVLCIKMCANKLSFEGKKSFVKNRFGFENMRI